MFLFDLDMSNIKSEALAQEGSKRKVFLNFCRTHWKTTVCSSLFFNEGAGFMDNVKFLRSHFIRLRYFPVKFAKFLTTSLRTPIILQNICEISDIFFWQ